ncbi:MAG: phosphoenolpyruvate synthase [Planctomycetes bacterium]|nr:phosphoenolpyruvate synthase [Planctomycetota bacterium]
MNTPDSGTFVIPFSRIGIGDIPTVGGKNASLGEMIRELSPLGVRVPDGFAIIADAFRLHLRQAGIEDWIYGRLDDLNVTDTRALAEAAAHIREKILSSPLPTPVRKQIVAAYAELSRSSGCPLVASDSHAESTGSTGGVDVAVRSSATAEDLPTASFAGQHESFLNIRGVEALDIAVRSCMASLFTDRAIAYRVQNKYDHRAVSLSVGVQRMVRSDLACAGTMFTLDTETGFRGVVMIDASWGLGETVVQGRVSPDEYWVHKATAKQGFRSIIRRELGDKATKLVYSGEGLAAARSVREVPVSSADRARFVLTDDEIITLARWAVIVEDHYSKRGGPGSDVPMDLEWAKDGRSGELFILQARPETVQSRSAVGTKFEVFRLKGKGKAILTGKSVGSRIACGPVRIVRSIADLPRFLEGEVLVAAMTDPDWEPVLRKAAAVVTDRGGRTCHAAIVSREMGLPCVVGTGHGTEALRDGQIVTISCADGDVGKVYEGAIPFQRGELDPSSLPIPRVPLMLNLADPAQAFRLCQLPSAGVGLMRIEFLVTNRIGVHPMALVHPELVPDPAQRAEIRRIAAGYTSLSEFFIDRLAGGVALIGAAFYPRPVIVRFSDFKTNEYAGLLGGAAFEPKEENPMIGFRGASRYYDDRYREGFALECAAIRRVRDQMGLTNVIVMIPFCRTLTEGRAVLSEMEKNGLLRGERGMQVYVMCEIPNNVVLAEEFSDLFDGFSIGSNDLTQLALGVDRDSSLLTHIFDERDPGVKRLIELVITKAHAKGRKVGICGEAPSNYPEFAQWLATVGIDSMSLNPDSLPGVARVLAKDIEADSPQSKSPRARDSAPSDMAIEDLSEAKPLAQGIARL